MEEESKANPNREALQPLDLSTLTPTEEEVFRTLIQGLSPEEIGTARGRSVATIRNHLKQIFVKLNVRSQRELIVRWYRDTPTNETRIRAKLCAS